MNRHATVKIVITRLGALDHVMMDMEGISAKVFCVQLKSVFPKLTQSTRPTLR